MTLPSKIPEAAEDDPIVHLAKRWSQANLPESSLEAEAARLPGFDLERLEALARWAEQAAHSHPRLGWAVTVAAESAAAGAPPFLRSLAAWYRAYAAHLWVHPERMAPALARARTGFAGLGERGWTAACDWLAHALPWLSQDLNASIQTLTRALHELEGTDCERYAPHCRLSLAYAQMLVGSSSEALTNIALSQAVFTQRQDLLNQARCWQQRASAVRRQGQYPQAVAALEQAIQVFEPLEARVDLARAWHILAYCQHYLTGEYPLAEALFDRAAGAFHALDIPLWEAQSVQGLVHIYMDTARLPQARQALTQARQLFSTGSHNTLLGDILLDSGRVELMWGSPSTCLEFLEQARQAYAASGSQRMEAIASMFLGQACSQFNRYQRALGQLESAQAYFQAYQVPERLAECQTYLAQAWSRLGNFEQAGRLLDEATAYYRSAGRMDMLIPASLQQAEVFYQAGQAGEAVERLRQALRLAQELDKVRITAVSHRLLGETLLAGQASPEAFEHLATAVRLYESIPMPIEEASARVALGEYYAQTAQTELARQAWEGALRLSAQAAHDVSWRANAGLARLAEQQGQPRRALAAYRRMTSALTRVRRGLYQPALLDGYLRQPAQALDKAIHLAASLGSTRDTLRFIEESKAQTLAVQFHEQVFDRAADPSPLDDLAAEIQWLEERLRVTAPQPAARFRLNDQAAWIKQLRQKHRQYDEALARLERQRLGGQVIAGRQPPFALPQFRALAGQAIAPGWIAPGWIALGWIALDYYLTPTELVGVTLTATGAQSWRSELSSRVRIALRACSEALRSGQAPLPADLEVLGAALIPEPVQRHLRPDMTLLIAPHRQLHEVPWACLPVRGPRARLPLAAACIPVVVPSLYNVSLLWARPPGPPVERRRGLLLAISDFGARRPALPFTRLEAGQLHRQMQPGSAAFLEDQATWPNLLALAQRQKLNEFAFWHIASHAFHDPVAGRLSGVALADGDLWLDRLWELAPLPRLVTLSACSGLQSKLFEGDEAIGLAATCLAAGAQQVIASLWPVRDDRAAALMVDFYQHWWAGQPPAQALALAQRAAAQHYGDDLEGWGSFLCLGAPGEPAVGSSAV